jgi:hypothetical protein
MKLSSCYFLLTYYTDSTDVTEHCLLCSELLWNCRVAVLDERFHWNCWRKIAIHRGDNAGPTASYALNYSAVSTKEKAKLQNRLGLFSFTFVNFIRMVCLLTNIVEPHFFNCRLEPNSFAAANKLQVQATFESSCL